MLEGLINKQVITISYILLTRINRKYKRKYIYLASLIIANKLINDYSYKNIIWVNLTGLKLKQINLIEIHFLKIIKYNIRTI